MSGTGCEMIQMQAVEYFLDLLDQEETGELKGHIKECPSCSNNVRGIRSDFEVLARWNDVTPSRKSIINLLRAYGGGSGDLAVVLPGEAEEEALAADVIADAEAAAPAAPGLLLGPTMSAKARARILNEFGLDSTGLRTPSRRRKQQKAAVDLQDLTARAEQAAARVSGRMSRSAAEGEWSALTGTTRIAGDTKGPDQALRKPGTEGEDLASKASSAWEKIKARRKKKGSDAEDHADTLSRERQSARWEALAGQTMLAGSEADEIREELTIDEDEQEAAALMGTTILSAQTTQSSIMPRYQSRVLQKIKSEGDVKRKLKRAAATTATRTTAWASVALGHAAVFLLLLLVVWTVSKGPEHPPITIVAKEPPPEDIPEKEEPEFLEELEETDPTEETEQQEDTLDKTLRDVKTISTATQANPDKVEVERTEPFIEPREGRGGQGSRGSGPLKNVELALDWLQKHQSPNGAWEWRNYRAQCEKHGGPACGADEIQVAAGEDRNFTPGLTALSLLAFTASGYHHTEPRAEAKPAYRERHARRRETVQKALTWLLSQQEADGAIGRKFKGNDDPDFEAAGMRQDPEGFMYNHCIATLALCDAYATSDDPALQAPAQKAIDFLCGAQDAKGGWDYYPAGHLPRAYIKDLPKRLHYRSDLSITGWAAVALKVAEMANLKVPSTVKKDALEFVRRMDGTASSNPEPRYAEGYWTGWNLPEVEQALSEARGTQKGVLQRVKRQLEKKGEVPEGRRGVAMTAVSALAKLSLGVSPSDGNLRAQVAHLVKNPPSEYALTHTPKGFTNHDHSYYYWYYGTLVLWNVDDANWHKWWDAALKGAIVNLQIAEGPAAGSWPACDPVWGSYAGRIYSTALCTLTLEVFYRYAPLTKKDRGGQLSASSYPELQREVEEGLAWLANPTGPPRPALAERLVEACYRLMDTVTRKGGDPDEKKTREAEVLALFERVTEVRTPDPTGAPADIAEWREQAGKIAAHLRGFAVDRCAKLPTRESAELVRRVLRANAKDDPGLAIKAVDALASKPLVWIVTETDAADVARLSDPSLDANLQTAAGSAYQRIQDAWKHRRELIEKRRAEAAAADESGAAPDGD